MDQFKAELDMILEKIPDEPNVTGSNYTPSACDLYTGKPSNSIVDQIRSANFSSKNQLRRMGQWGGSINSLFHFSYFIFNGFWDMLKW